MPSILLVKTSSLGDVVHNLPVVTDVLAAFPGTAVDWVVEEAFAAIPRLHPGVRRVFTCATRRWRRSLLQPATWREIGRLADSLGRERYDAVIDTQGLVKSAWITRMARGPRHGLDWVSAREPLRPFYDRTHRVPWGRHAVVRNRELAGLVLDYAPAGAPDYGIVAPPLPAIDRNADGMPPGLADGASFSWLPERPVAVLLHGSSAEAKEWPEHQWKKLAAQLTTEGMAAVLPWGDEAARARAHRIAHQLRHVITAPRLSLQAMATLLGHARLCVGVDTGLTHLAAALGRPTVGIYVRTDPAATGVLAPGNARNAGSRRGPPPLGEVVAAIRAVL